MLIFRLALSILTTIVTTRCVLVLIGCIPWHVQPQMEAMQRFTVGIGFNSL